MYGLGLAVAWLFPAPSHSQWVFRIAIAPLLAIAITTPAAIAMHLAGWALNPLQLASSGMLAAMVALRLHWRAASGDRRCSPPKALGIPFAVVTLSLLSWALSLRNHGLYLPNRDFKNHAAMVAEVAWSRSAELALVFRDSPVAEPRDSGFYPLGLHTLLGWIAPSREFNTLGLTAAAAVLACAISLPLALVALARLWDSDSRMLPVLAGLASVSFPAATEAFGIGSVTVLVGTATYGAALAALWAFLQRPGMWSGALICATAFGLLFLHVAEAVALFLVAILALPTVGRHVLRSLEPGHWILLGLMVLAVSLVGLAYLPDIPVNSDSWDIEPNTNSIIVGLVWPLVLVPGVGGALAMIWALLFIIGVWRALVERLSRFPLVVLSVPMILSVIATMGTAPGWLRILSAPWYGAVGRVSLLAVAPIALIAVLPLARAMERENRSGRLAAMASPAGLLTAALLVAAGSHAVAGDRRHDLVTTLAGAGDTPTVAKALLDRLSPGETVLNFEGDGSANLFAAARVPVLATLRAPETDATMATDYMTAISGMMRVGDPDVRRALENLRVGYVALGTTSLYWGVSAGYDISSLLAQPELQMVLEGTDLVVLRYEPTAVPR
jgi:hypothetical protein